MVLIGHVSPEAMAGGPIAYLEDGDIIDIDIPNRKLNVLIVMKKWINVEMVGKT